MTELSDLSKQFKATDQIVLPNRKSWLRLFLHSRMLHVSWWVVISWSPAHQSYYTGQTAE